MNGDVFDDGYDYDYDDMGTDSSEKVIVKGTMTTATVTATATEMAFDKMVFIIFLYALLLFVVHPKFEIQCKSIRTNTIMT